MKKKLMTLLLVLVLALSSTVAVGCGPMEMDDFDILNLPY